ncbi:hypothetical protein PGT21_010990 [Puccinia graminis f. sp. tritici]|uniref:Wax synthase domain-containing protein n=1 Tax=Puccinia graminis f. sp. tritici TaxID=56615 RepID=A0A5B0PQU8_PUCGR|nr:hypothetical protein PGT21_010990 [Puccinia graminis f. sp. tritici]
MASITVAPALSISYLWQLTVNYITVPVLLIQGALLHPYFEPDPQARKARAWLAPLIIFLVTYSQKTRLFYPLEDYLHINYCIAAIPTFHIICVTLQYATHRGPARQIDVAKHKKEDDEQASSSDTDSDNSSSITNSDSQVTPTEVVQKRRVSKMPAKKKNKVTSLKSKESAPSIGELARFSIWMTSSPRSLGYVWGPPASVLLPAPKRTMAKFLLRLLGRLVLNQLALIAFCSIALPTAAHPEKIYGWVSQYVDLPDTWPVRFFCEKVFMLPWGTVGMHAFDLVGCIFIIWELLWITGARAVLPSTSKWRPEPFDTTEYPDLFSRAVLRTSLTEFWSKGWQSTFRRDFIFCGAEPLAKLFSPCGLTVSRLAGLMGAMLMSGLLHEWGLVSCTNKIDWSFRTTIFFLLSGVGIALEMIFKKLTGRRVGGVLGWFWLWGWFAFWCQMFMDAWFDIGVGLAGMRGPYEVNQWPMAKFLVPLGPLLPDEVLSMFSVAFWNVSSVLIGR